MKNVKRGIGLAAVAAMACAGAANADVTLDLGDNLLAGDNINTYEFNLSGEMVGFEIIFDFDPLDAGGAWASDMVFVLIGPGLEGVSWGGFNTDFGFPNQGTWAFDGSGSAAAGTYSDSVVHGAQSDGVWTLGIGNGWTTGGEVAYNNVSVTLFGTIVPAPGAVALLGLAGLAGSRRRR